MATTDKAKKFTDIVKALQIARALISILFTVKLTALLYHILPPTTTITGYTINVPWYSHGTKFVTENSNLYPPFLLLSSTLPTPPQIK